VNDAPIAVDDQYAIVNSELFTVADPGLRVNDFDPDTGDTFAVTDFGTTTGGFTGDLIDELSELGATVTLDANGSFTYDPSTSAVLMVLTRDESLVDEFIYEITDSNGATDVGVVEVTVSGTNKAPTVFDESFATDEDTVLAEDNSRNVLVNDTDPELDFLTVSGFGHDPASTVLTGTSAMGADVELFANGTFTYDPTNAPAIQALPFTDPAVPVDDTFDYTVFDGQSNTAHAFGTVTINLTGINDAPEANDDTLNVDDNSKPIAPRNTEIPIDLLANDIDVDLGSSIFLIEITADPDPAKATISLQADPNLVDFGVVTFTPATDFSGNVTFQYKIADEHLAYSNVATVSVEVNDAPVAVDDFAEAYQDFRNSTTTIDVLANDTDVDGTLDPVTVQVTVGPTHGTIVDILADGSVEYRPDIGYLGADSFQYTVNDDDGAVSEFSAIVTLDVIPDPFTWHNRGNGLDVNDDGSVSPIDALLVIIELGANGSTLLDAPSAGNSPPPYFDVNQDGFVAPNDVIQVINFLNVNANGEAGEGEFSISVDMTQSVANESIAGDSVVGPAVQVPERKVVDNGFTDMRNMRSSGLSTIRGEVLEDLLGEIAADLTDVQEDGLLVDIALNDFFG
jgi:VCBS repeat-containing protein